MRVCICGGGNLGHVVAGFIAAQGGHDVRMLTRHPERWGHQLVIEAPHKETFLGHIDSITSAPDRAVGNADIVMLCLPGYSIREVLQQIRPYVGSHTAIGSVVSSTGFFFEAMQILSPDTPLFGFQRVPFISRVIEYGHRAQLMGYKDSLSLAIEQCPHPETLRQELEALFKTPVQLMQSFYEVSLSNSNPLLHPARLYNLWRDWHEGIVYPAIPRFYEEWTEEASEFYLAMDQELQSLLAALSIRQGSIPTVLDYYESTDATSLTRKLRSIDAFKGILAPMKPVEGGFMPNFQSRYFTEDFPFGLAIVHKLAHEKGIPSPTIDRILEWGITCIKNHNITTK